MSGSPHIAPRKSFMGTALIQLGVRYVTAGRVINTLTRAQPSVDYCKVPIDSTSINKQRYASDAILYSVKLGLVS